MSSEIQKIKDLLHIKDFWTTRDNRVVPISELRDEHINNILVHFLKKGFNPEDIQRMHLVVKVIYERERRGLEYLSSNLYLQEANFLREYKSYCMR